MGASVVTNCQATRRRWITWRSRPAIVRWGWASWALLAVLLGAYPQPSHGQEPPFYETSSPTLPYSALTEGTPILSKSAGEPVPATYQQATPNKLAPKFAPIQKELPTGVPGIGELPFPSVMPPFGPNQHRLPCLPGTVGAAPVPSAEVQKKFSKYVTGLKDAENTLDLVAGRTRLMMLKAAPKRVQVGDDSIAAYTILTTTQISLQGRRVGVTVLTLWFTAADDATKEEILSYYVRVYPDPEAKHRLELVYESLSKEINCLFPDSNVCLKVVGDKIAVTGFAHDVDQAAKILQVVRANAPDPRGKGAEVAKIPVDRVQSGAAPGEVLANGAIPIGAEQYSVLGRPEVINLLKVAGEQQVMLRVTVAEVNRAAARSIGMNFALLNHNGVGVFANNTGSITTGGVTSLNGTSGVASGFLQFSTGNGFIPTIPGVPAGVGGFNNLPLSLDGGQVGLAISALRTLNYARSLAEPTLVTMNGQTAKFHAGGQFPVPIVTGNTANGLQGVSFVPFGVQLSFTPFVTDRDRVRLMIGAEVSTRDLSAGTTNIGGASVPSLSTRNFETVVELREGQTLAVAGLIQNNLGGNASRVPFFGDMPILSRLLGFDTMTAGEQELIVLITPELVHPMEPHEVPALPGADIFEPTDCEFYLLGRLESHNPVDYRSPVRTDWSRLHQEYESLYLFGPHGQVPEH